MLAEIGSTTRFYHILGLRSFRLRELSGLRGGFGRLIGLVVQEFEAVASRLLGQIESPVRALEPGAHVVAFREAGEPGERVVIERLVDGDASYQASARVEFLPPETYALRRIGEWRRQQRRSDVRVSTYGLDLTVIRPLAADEPAEENFSVADLSAGGLSIRGVDCFEAGEEVRCIFELPGEHRFDLRARVVRCGGSIANRRAAIGRGSGGGKSAELAPPQKTNHWDLRIPSQPQSELRPIVSGASTPDGETMEWRRRLLELLARGARTQSGERFDPELIVRLHDRIEADPELSARLSGLDKHGFHSEFLVLYEAEAERDS